MGIEHNELFGEVPEKVKEFCNFFSISAEDMKLSKLNNRWILSSESESLDIHLDSNGMVMYFVIGDRNEKRCDLSNM